MGNYDSIDMIEWIRWVNICAIRLKNILAQNANEILKKNCDIYPS